MTFIEDGTGSGTKAEVNGLNRLTTTALTQNVANFHNIDGDRYNINTDDVTLTSGSESMILYVKNNEARDLIIDSYVQILGASTGGSGNLKSYTYRNPTGGTIISDANTTSIISNLNYGSSNTLTADIYTGGEGKTQTGGTKSLTSLLTPPTTNIVSVGDIILEKGNSIAISIIPQSGNTSMLVHLAMLVYLKDTRL